MQKGFLVITTCLFFFSCEWMYLHNISLQNSLQVNINLTLDFMKFKQSSLSILDSVLSMSIVSIWVIIAINVKRKIDYQVLNDDVKVAL